MPESKTIMVTRTYLAEPGAALTGVPAEVREGLLNGVREELDRLDATEAGRRIQELGDPQFIAAEARSEASGAAAKIVGSVRDTRSYAIVAAVLVMVGGFVIPGLVRARLDAGRKMDRNPHPFRGDGPHRPRRDNRFATNGTATTC